jgi:hypothetical protein
LNDNRTRRLRLADNATTTIAKAGLSLSQWSQLAGVSYATIKALRTPGQQPNRKGGMQETTAWKLSRAYAQTVGIDEDEAFEKLIVVETTGQK